MPKADNSITKHDTANPSEELGADVTSIDTVAPAPVEAAISFGPLIGSSPNQRPRRKRIRTAGDALADLFDLARDSVVVISRNNLAKRWRISAPGVGKRLDLWTVRGILTRETLSGNRGTRIVFLRAPTAEELADTQVETEAATKVETRSATRPRATLQQVADRISHHLSTASGNVVPLRHVDRGRLGASLGSLIHAAPTAVAPVPWNPQETELPAVPAPVSTLASADFLPVVPTAVTEVSTAVSTLPQPTADGVSTLVADVDPTPTPPRFPPLTMAPRIPLPFFRPAHGLRLVSGAAIAVSIAMIAYHSAGSSASSVFHWWATLAMAIILSTGKVVLGSQAEGFFADGAKQAGIFCVIGALFLLAADSSLLYAFRGDSLSNAAAIEKAALETRQRIQERLDGLLAEQKRLVAADIAPEASSKPVRLVGEVEAELAALEHDRDCRLIQPRARRGEPKPAQVPRNEAACENKRAELQAELARATNAAKDEARSLASDEKREKRLAELPDLISKAETELAGTHARAAPDHGASIVARGLNWIPAGFSEVVWGKEVRPVEGRGVEIFWSWAFVLAAEMFAVGGFAVAARADRRARDRRRRELGEIA